MIKTNGNIWLLLLMLICSKIHAQQNNTLFFMQNMPQVNVVNPAVGIDSKWHIGMPLLGSTHINQYSSGFALTDLFRADADGTLHLDPESSFNSFNNLEVLAAEVHVSLLWFGYNYKQHYFTFALNEKANTYNIYSKDAALFLHQGNSQFEGTSADFDGVRINGNHYREYAFGWATSISNKLDLGIKAKFLFGKGNAYMQPTNADLYTHNNTFALEMNAIADANVSFPLIINSDEDGKLESIQLEENIDWLNYALNGKNKGLGFDFGFVYKINESTEISGSLLDIGFINWQTNPYKLTTNGTMNIDGINDQFNNNDAREVLDSIADYFNPLVSEDTYTSSLTPVLYLGISQNINSYLNLGALYHTEIYKNRIHSNFSFSANTSINKLSASASYTLQNNEFNNFGLGLGYQIGMFHLHAISDNIPGFFALDDTRNINLRFGISFLPYKRESKSQSGAFDCPGDPYNAVNRSSSKSKKRRYK